MTMSDLRYFDSLDRGEREWTGTGIFVQPLLRDGVVQMWRAYDGVHEHFAATRADAVALSRVRKQHEP